ncbi:MAG: hypothetical protein ABSF22_20900 [Bryobacteraceae bacterium]|jgi:hypothetical protein
MKRLVLASILCVTLRAQDKPLPLAPPPVIDPADPLGVKNFQLLHPRDVKVANKLTLMGNLPPAPGVCSVPLLEARVAAVDPGIATSPSNSSVPMPQARVPAPACTK